MSEVSFVPLDTFLSLYVFHFTDESAETQGDRLGAEGLAQW